jgi:hypothetical protein
MLMIGGASMFAILFLVGRAAKAEVERYERAAELSFDEQQHNGSLPLESQNHSALLSGDEHASKADDVNASRDSG